MKKIRVMIVSHPGTWQRVLQKNIESYSIVEVVGAVSGSLSAMQLASQHEPDLVLIDSSIPFDDAVVLIKKLKTEFSKTLSIAITDTTQQRRKMSRSGADYTVSSGNFEPQIGEIIKRLGRTLAKSISKSGTTVQTKRGEREEVDAS